MAWELGEKHVQGVIMMRTMLKMMGGCMVEIGSDGANVEIIVTPGNTTPPP